MHLRLRVKVGLKRVIASEASEISFVFVPVSLSACICFCGEIGKLFCKSRSLNQLLLVPAGLVRYFW